LNKKKASFRPTEVLPFNFQETKKGVQREYLDEENQTMKLTKIKPSVDKVEEAKKWRHHKPKIEPQSTKQFER